MKAKIKAGILFLTLAIPVLIYLFLRGYGENKFTVPVYFEEGVPPDTTDCSVSEKPHILNPETGFTELNGKEGSVLSNHLTVIDIVNHPDIYSDPADPAIQRILDLSKAFPTVRILSLREREKNGREINERINNIQPCWKVVYADPDSLEKFARCQLVLNDYDKNYEEWKKRYILADQKGQIRGYYSARDYEEIDRLILEMKIILTEEYSAGK